ncbi:TPA: site-2 protease family protein [archaeon]|uniref:Site-2 protease family protein n=1 Tax=Candidatus Undinarchaeum marinum TaxID=2756141 RepID=A0A832UP66_9ARCH|nr:site-2 protease family protein [Candidatus Undinarchaeum marinum]
MGAVFVWTIVIGLILVGQLVLSKHKGVSIYGPLAVYNTKRGVKLLDKISGISPRFWKVFGNLGVITGFFLMALVTYSLLINAIRIFRIPEAAPGAALAIPGITIPLWEGIIGIVILLVFHEMSHGVLARREKVKVESVGTLSLGFIPIGAFVRPNEKSIRKAKLSARMRIYAAGSFMNVTLAIILVSLLAFVVLPYMTEPVDGIKLLAVEEGSPAELAGLSEGMIIQEVEDGKIHDLVSFVNTLDRQDLSPGDEIIIKIDDSEYTVTTAERNGRAFMGITFCGAIPAGEIVKLFIASPMTIRILSPECYPSTLLPQKTMWFIIYAIMWTAILNFGVGLINLLPFRPLDGGLMFSDAVRRIIKNEKLAKQIIIVVGSLVFLLLLFNFIGPKLLGILA